jgi:oxygen-dependent protoporphyrinogen oxidase
VLAYRDDRTFAEFLGDVPAEVDAIFRPTIQRSSGEPEQVSAGYGIGYFQLVWDREGGLTRNVLGGSARLPQAIAAALGERVRTGARAERVVAGEEGVTVHLGGEQIRARFAVVATPAFAAGEILEGIPAETAAALGRVAYGPYVVGALLTDEPGPMPYDGIYAVATPKASFNMLFNTANVTRGPGLREPGGTLMVYSAAGLADALADRDDEEIARIYTDDVARIFPAVAGHVREVVIRRWPQGLPHPRPGRHLLQPALERPLGNVFLAGDYLGTTYVDTAVTTGTAAAHAIRRRLRA